jgi:hypothetical protein
MRFSRMTTRRVMIAVAIIAIDLAYLQGRIDINFLVAVPVLQVGLFRVVSSRGALSRFWLGFELFGWIGVIVFQLGVGPLWLRFLDQQLNDSVAMIAQRRPDIASAVATVVLYEGTPIKDTLPGVLPESLIAGIPILTLALIGSVAFSIASYASRLPTATLPARIE